MVRVRKGRSSVAEGLCQQDMSGGKGPLRQAASEPRPQSVMALNYEHYSVLIMVIIISNGKGQMYPINKTS